jgi:3-mercaptopyruvate sulfurtransferase SseA
LRIKLSRARGSAGALLFSCSRVDQDGRPLDAGELREHARAMGAMETRPRLTGVPEIDAAQALTRYEAGDALFVDSRDRKDYQADHIPGAVNLPWDSLLKPVTAKRPTPETRGYFVWREPAEIHTLLRVAGITSRQPLAVYDQSGGRAAHVVFALYLMGHSQAVVYSGGWREYGAREDVEIER